MKAKALPALLVLVVLISIFAAPMAMVHAQGADLDPVLNQPLVPDCEGSGCGICELVELGQNVINFAVAFTVVVAILLFVFAGFKYITAAGDTGQVKAAHKIFRSVLVGMIIVLVAWLVVDLVMKTFLTDEGNYGPWNEILCEGGDSGGGGPSGGDSGGGGPSGGDSGGGGPSGGDSGGGSPSPSPTPPPTSPPTSNGGGVEVPDEPTIDFDVPVFGGDGDVDPGLVF